MKSEAAVSAEVRLELSKRGVRCWRNNVGCLRNEKTGEYVRYGLCNESKKMNTALKSSDLIGVTPVEITQDMVGQTVGVFTSYEIKKEGWVYSGVGREAAQNAWLKLVRSLGGIAGFIARADDLPG